MLAPEYYVVDHINGNGLDNRKCNLRLCFQSENTRNRATQKGKKYKGVSKRPNGNYRARITIDGCIINIGDFTTEIKAALAYNEAAIHYHGQYARLNEV